MDTETLTLLPASPFSPAELSARIRERALSLGFDLVGFAPAIPPEHGFALERWLAAGMAGEMTYLERNAEKRLDPQRVLPGAKSIVSVAMNYWLGPSSDGLGEDLPRGRVARYAWGDDYHEVLLDRLKRLQGEIEELSGGKAYVDTGPILEREAAANAGVGWVGKHTNLIRHGTGSWLLLGEILTTAELEYDVPTRNLCGTCTRCIDACPTDAIVEPYRVDSRKCISYLTIELKGRLPTEMRPQIGDWIFGCDICQEVCPWNRKIGPAPQDHFTARGEDVRHPDLIELMRVDEETFRERYRKSPIKRAKRRGLLRNAAVALGNSGDRRVVPALIQALQDLEPLVREHAAWALGQLGGTEARNALEARLESETEESVLESIQAALTRCPNGEPLDEQDSISDGCSVSDRIEA
jgi:epoxyqueuosine reductase